MDKKIYCDVLILTVITIFLFEQARAYQADNSDEDLSLERWNQFKERFGKRYSGAEDQKRFVMKTTIDESTMVSHLLYPFASQVLLQF